MKKLFSLGMMMFLVLVLGACNAETDHITITVESSTETVEETITFERDTEQSLLALLETVFDVRYDTFDEGYFITAIGDLDTPSGSFISISKNGEALQEGLATVSFEDGDHFTFSREWLDDAKTLTFTVHTPTAMVEETLSFESGTEETVFDLLLTVFDVDYGEFDGGVFLNAVGDLDSPEGSFISVSKNGVPIAEAINIVSFEDGDHFTFEREWWDQAAYIAYVLDAMIDAHLDAWAVETPSIQVFLALYHLDMLDEFSFEKADLDDEASTSDHLKNIIIARGLGLDYQADQQHLADQVEPVHLYTDAMMVLGLYDAELEASETFISGFVEDTADLDPADFDHDTLVMIYLALEILGENEATLLAIESRLYDAPYEHLYGYNAATLTQMLLVVGLDYDASAFDVDGLHLLDRLMEHYNHDGGFMYEIDDDDIDAFFTTPQAFFALAYLHGLHEETSEHPFLIGE